MLLCSVTRGLGALGVTVVRAMLRTWFFQCSGTEKARGYLSECNRVKTPCGHLKNKRHRTKKLQTGELETLASVAIMVTQGTLQPPPGRGRVCSPHTRPASRAGWTRSGAAHTAGPERTCHHRSPGSQTPSGPRWRGASGWWDWRLPCKHCFPSKLRLVSSRAKLGLPRISCRTCDPLTSLLTEALLPSRARNIPRADASSPQ